LFEERASSSGTRSRIYAAPERVEERLVLDQGPLGFRRFSVDMSGSAQAGELREVDVEILSQTPGAARAVEELALAALELLVAQECRLLHLRAAGLDRRSAAQSVERKWGDRSRHGRPRTCCGDRLANPWVHREGLEVRVPRKAR